MVLISGIVIGAIGTGFALWFGKQALTELKRTKGVRKSKRREDCEEFFKSDFCGTAYERDKYDNVVRIETFQNPVRIYKSRMDVDDYIVSEMGIDNATQMAVKQLSRNLADAIAENMEIECQYDPMFARHKINARVRIVEPSWQESTDNKGGR